MAAKRKRARRDVTLGFYAAYLKWRSGYIELLISQLEDQSPGNLDIRYAVEQWFKRKHASPSDTIFIDYEAHCLVVQRANKPEMTWSGLMWSKPRNRGKRP